MHALAHVAITDQTPNDCTVNTRIRDTATVLPGAGLSAGDSVRLVLRPGFHARFSLGPQGKPPDSLTTADMFASLTLERPAPAGCVPVEGVTDCEPETAAAFFAQGRRRVDATSGPTPSDPDGSLTSESSWSWELHSNAAPDDGDSGEGQGEICPVWPQCNVLVTDPAFLPLEPFAIDTGAHAIQFEATVGEPIAIDARLNALVQAYSGPGSAGVDMLRSLEFSLAPAPGYEGATIAFESAGGAADAEPPVLTLPGDRVVDATSPEGARVTYSATATDALDPAPQLSCAPPSGSTFAIGATSVACTATDSAGNSASGGFSVTVRGAKAQLAQLVGEVVASARLSPAAKALLLARLQSLVGAFDPAKATQRQAVCGALLLFKSAVHALSGRTIPASLAAEWIEDATRIMAVLGCR